MSTCLEVDEKNRRPARGRIGESISMQDEDDCSSRGRPQAMSARRDVQSKGIGSDLLSRS